MKCTMKVRDAARVLGVHENTVRNWMDRGLISWEEVRPRHHTDRRRPARRVSEDEVFLLKQSLTYTVDGNPAPVFPLRPMHMRTITRRRPPSAGR